MQRTPGSLTGALRSFARAVLWPVRRVLDPRFADVNRRIELTKGEVQAARMDIGSVSGNVKQVVGSYAATGVEASTFVGTELRDIRAALAELRDETGAWRDVVEQRAVRERLTILAAGRVDDLDTAVADVLNYAGSHRGYAAQRDLWFNPPLVVGYGDGDVRVTSVNERIVEVPFALRALGEVPIGGRVLDVGCAESTLALALASMGYEVTALDLRPYPLAHPNLTAAASPIETWRAEPGSFEAVICVSTLEHIGLGWYGDPRDAERGDAAALMRLRELLRPGGLLVLTVPYGAASVDDIQRRYDRASLERLLADWEVRERIIVEQRNAVTWAPVEESTKDAVALVVARTPSAA